MVPAYGHFVTQYGDSDSQQSHSSWNKKTQYRNLILSNTEIKLLPIITTLNIRTVEILEPLYKGHNSEENCLIMIMLFLQC